MTITRSRVVFLKFNRSIFWKHQPQGVTIYQFFLNRGSKGVGKFFGINKYHYFYDYDCRTEEYEFYWSLATDDDTRRDFITYEDHFTTGCHFELRYPGVLFL